MSNRRDFIKKTAVASAALSLSSFPTLNAGILGANEKLVCGVIGVKGMGFADLKAFLAQPNTECGALCDVDANLLRERIADVEKIQGKTPKGYYGRSHGVGFVGNEGTLVVDRSGWEVIPEPKGSNPTLERVDLIRGDGKGLNNHMANFIDGVKNGATLNCPVEIAAGDAKTCHLGNIDYKTGRRLYWDSGYCKFINDKDADRYLQPNYRKPWKVPLI